MNSTSSPTPPPKSASAFSTFLPRFKTKESSSTSLSPAKPSPSPSSSRRSSISDENSLSTKPSPALSSKSSFSDFKWATSSRREASTASDSTAKANPSLPKLTLTQEGFLPGDNTSVSPIYAPSPQNIVGPSFADGMIEQARAGRGAGEGRPAKGPGVIAGFGDGSPQGWTDGNDLTTPTAENVSGALTSDPKEKAQSTRSSRASSISNPNSPSIPPSSPRKGVKTSSTFSSTSSHHHNPQHHPPNFQSSDSLNSFPASSAEPDSSRSRASKKIIGIGAVIAGISKDLVSPAQGLLQSSSSQATPRATNAIPSSPSAQDASQSRARSGTGDSSSAASQSSSRRRSSLSIKSKLLAAQANRPPTSPSANNSLPLPPRPVSEARTSIDISMRPALPGDGDQSDAYDSYGDELDDDSDSAGSEEDDELDGLPAVTGFAVASQKRNADFHALFGKAVPEDDYLIEDYGCALQRDILLQGRLYVSEHHIAFHANIFGWITNLVIAFADIRRVDKKMTAFVIPNAIMITTYDAKHTFASFLSRDMTYDVLFNIWRISHPSALSAQSSESLGFPSSSTAPTPGSARSVEDLSEARGLGHAPAGVAKKAAPRRKSTACACGKAGQHFSETVMDAVFPSTPEKIYNLMFTSGFVKTFMSEDQKLMDIQISDWAPASSGSNLLTRKSSYIKPLTGGFGPKQTKCELEDVTAHADFDDYVSMVTTTRNPDVPSGGVFSVKTRTCLSWASAGSTRVLVTTEVQWTGRSFIKGIIDSSALAGQKATHAALERAIRTYIADHITEFQVEGVDEEEADQSTLATQPPSTADTRTGVSTTSALSPNSVDKLAQKTVDDGTFFQYGVDSLTNGIKQLFDGLVAIFESGFNSLGLYGAFGILVAVLVASNIWTYTSLQASRVAPRKPVIKFTANAHAPGGPSSADSVADAIKGFLEDYLARQPLVRPDTQDVSMEAISRLELRIASLEARLAAVPSAEPQLELDALD